MPYVSRRLSAPAVALLVLMACQAPTGTSSPSGQPTPVPPTASGSPSPVTGGVDHPTDADVVVLRMEETGGLVPMEYNATKLPVFTLYGDGTVIFQEGLPPFEPGVVRAPLRTASMTPQQVSTLLAFALGPSGLQNAREHYPHPLMADASSTVFTINAGGVDKKVTIDALEEGDEVTAPEDVAERRAFGHLKTTLNTFSEAVASGEVSDTGPYDPGAYLGILIEAGGLAAEVRDWPWEDLTPEDFVASEEFGFRTARLTPEHAAKVIDDPRGGIMAVAVTGPDRAPYTINIRPLLPEELEPAG